MSNTGKPVLGEGLLDVANQRRVADDRMKRQARRPMQTQAHAVVTRGAGCLDILDGASGGVVRRVRRSVGARIRTCS